MADRDVEVSSSSPRGGGVVRRVVFSVAEFFFEALIEVVADVVREVVLENAKEIAEDASKALWKSWGSRRRRAKAKSKPAKGAGGRPRHPFKVITGRTAAAGSEVGRRVKVRYVKYVHRNAGRRLDEYVNGPRRASHNYQDEPRLALESAVRQAQGRGLWKRRL